MATLELLWSIFLGYVFDMFTSEKYGPHEFGYILEHSMTRHKKRKHKDNNKCPHGIDLEWSAHGCPRCSKPNAIGIPTNININRNNKVCLPSSKQSTSVALTRVPLPIETTLRPRPKPMAIIDKVFPAPKS